MCGALARLLARGSSEADQDAEEELVNDEELERILKEWGSEGNESGDLAGV